MRIYWTNNFKQGNLGMMARPRGNDWLDDDIKKLSFSNTDIVVSLLEKSEEQELGIQKEKEHCIKYGMEFISYPIIDRSLPEDRNSFNKLAKLLNQKIKDGKKVVIHCRMGIGRTSVLAATILLIDQPNNNSVFDFLSEIRTLNVPDTEEQINWTLK
jgi:protein-tyrosine phosphatase